MTREEAVKHLENMKWLLGVNNTTVDDIPLTKVIDDIAALLKAQEPAVDAIPVDWLHEKMLYGEPDESKTAWRTLKMWQREQGART